MNTAENYMMSLKPQYCKIGTVACLNILRKSIIIYYLNFKYKFSVFYVMQWYGVIVKILHKQILHELCSNCR